MPARRFLSGLALAFSMAAAMFTFAPAAHAQDAEAKPDIQNFGTWSTRCELEGKEKKNCHAFVDVRIGEEKQRILYLGIGYGPRDGDNDGKKDLFLFAIAPLGTVLPSGIGWAIDENTKFSQQFMYCLPAGCQTEILLTEERLNALKKGKQMEVLFRIIGQGDAKIPIKLDGISKAIAAVPQPK